MIPIELIDRLRAWFFARDRDITMRSGSTITLGDGRIVDTELNGVAPIGGVIFWPSTAGAIPSNWTTFSAAAGRFLIGTSGSFANGSTGGASTVDIQHSHTEGSLAADSEGHDHFGGTLATDQDSHSHTISTSVTNTDHLHQVGTLSLDTTTDTVDVDTTGTAVTISTDTHTHSLTNSVASNTHNHTLSGSMANGTHTHTFTGGSKVASDSHGHTVSGSTDTELSSAQSILPPYLVGTWIQRTS